VPKPENQVTGKTRPLGDHLIELELEIIGDMVKDTKASDYGFRVYVAIEDPAAAPPIRGGLLLFLLYQAQTENPRLRRHRPDEKSLVLHPPGTGKGRSGWQRPLGTDFLDCDTVRKTAKGAKFPQSTQRKY
jgi:hypothetical protein